MHRFTFRKRQRLTKALEYQAVFDRGCRKPSGPLLLWVLPNDLGYDRLGLTVGRRVGGAVRRSHLKRRLREAFRLMQHELPGGYDIVVTARAHAGLRTADYQRLMRAAIEAGDRAWRKRARRAAEREDQGGDERDA
jgi:ribonuclease P protein component